MELNAQDLFLDLEYEVSPGDVQGLTESQWQTLGPGSLPKLKPLYQLRGLARAIRQEDPDVIAICEVGGMVSLKNFAQLFLGGDYLPLFDSSPSGRGIDCAYLVHRDLNLRPEIHGHRKVPVSFSLPFETDEAVRDELVRWLGGHPLPNTKDRTLSRDVPELRLYREGESEPALILLMAHLKSKVDHDRIDHEGTIRREAEFRVVLGLRNAVQKKNPNTPVILAGDMNGNAQRRGTGREFHALYRETDLRDCLAIAELPLASRYTHITFAPNGETHQAQIDFIFLPSSLHSGVECEATYVHRYQTERGEEIPPPESLKERKRLPSDHYPLLCTVEIAERTKKSPILERVLWGIRKFFDRKSLMRP